LDANIQTLKGNLNKRRTKKGDGHGDTIKDRREGEKGEGCGVVRMSSNYPQRGGGRGRVKDSAGRSGRVPKKGRLLGCVRVKKKTLGGKANGGGIRVEEKAKKCRREKRGR